MSATVSLTIVETVHYSAEFTIEELNALCVKHGIAPHDPDGETGDLTAWLQDEASAAIEKEPGRVAAALRRGGSDGGEEPHRPHGHLTHALESVV